MRQNYNLPVTMLEPGDRFIAKNPSPRTYQEILIVTENARHAAFVAVDRNGKEFVRQAGGALVGKDGEGKMYTTWTLPLPNLPDAETISYAQAFLELKDEPVLLHVRDVGEKFVTAKLVFSSFEEYALEGEEIPYTFTSFGPANVMDQEIVIPVGELALECAAGDLVLLDGFRCEYEDGVLVTHRPLGASHRNARPHVLGRDVSEDTLKDYIPVSKPRSIDDGQMFLDAGKSMFTDHQDFYEETGRAHARTEPDEGLVLWMPSTYRDGSTDCCFLGTTGYTFYITDAPSDNFYGENIEPGLWLCQGAKYWGYTSYEGEHDSGIDAEWVPATLEDLERFGYTIESAANEIREYLELPEDETENDDRKLVEEWIAKAHAAATADKAAVPAA